MSDIVDEVLLTEDNRAPRDIELSRMRVSKHVHDAVAEAARRRGITMTSWRRNAYVSLLAHELGADWWKSTRDAQAKGENGS